MKTAVALLGYLVFIQNSLAQSPPSVQEIKKQIIRSVTDYANSISCPDVKVDPKQIAALVPYVSESYKMANNLGNDRSDEKYAVLWHGDIGCNGGSGTYQTNISIVTIGAGGSYVVNPLQSSPVIQFESPTRFIESIFRSTRDSLIMEGMEHAPKDANCCPSIKVRFTLRADKKGNWKLVEKNVIPINK